MGPTARGCGGERSGAQSTPGAPTRPLALPQPRRALRVWRPARVGARRAVAVVGAVHRVWRAQLHGRARDSAVCAVGGRAGAGRGTSKPHAAAGAPACMVGPARVQPRRSQRMRSWPHPHPRSLPCQPSFCLTPPQILALSLNTAADFGQPLVAQALDWGEAGTSQVRGGQGPHRGGGQRAWQRAHLHACQHAGHELLPAAQRGQNLLALVESIGRSIAVLLRAPRRPSAGHLRATRAPGGPSVGHQRHHRAAPAGGRNGGGPGAAAGGPDRGEHPHRQPPRWSAPGQGGRGGARGAVAPPLWHRPCCSLCLQRLKLGQEQPAATHHARPQA